MSVFSNFYKEEKKGSFPSEWRDYITYSNRPAAKKLRGNKEEKGLLKRGEHMKCAYSLSDSYQKLRFHVRDDNRTVQVQSQVQKGTNETIENILQSEDPAYLLTCEEMHYINALIKALGEEPFPFNIMKNGTSEYAIPQLRNMADKVQCLKSFRELD